LAAGDSRMQFVADPGFLVAFAVFLGAEIARAGQIGEPLIEVLSGLPFEPRRLGFWPFFVLARASALARRLRAVGRRLTVFLVVRLLLGRPLARVDLGGVACDYPDDAPAERALDQRRVHLVGQTALRELREGAGKRRLRGRLRASLPTEDAPKRLVDVEALDQLPAAALPWRLQRTRAIWPLTRLRGFVVGKRACAIFWPP